jgi:transposase InsO family protein
MAAIDCCTREIVGRQLELRCRTKESTRLIERSIAERGIPPRSLTIGTDNGSAFTARAFKALLAGLGVAHRRGGYRDPESQAFIESWFGKLKERCVWLHGFETLDEARRRDRRLRRALPREAALEPRLPDTRGGETDLGRCPGARIPTKRSGLRCQRAWGAGHTQSCAPVGGSAVLRVLFDEPQRGRAIRNAQLP